MAMSTSHASYGSFYANRDLQAPSGGSKVQPNAPKDRQQGIKPLKPGQQQMRLTTPMNGSNGPSGQNGFHNTAPERERGGGARGVSFQPSIGKGKNPNANARSADVTPFTPTMGRRAPPAAHGGPADSGGRLFPSMGKGGNSTGDARDGPTIRPGPSASGMYSNSSSTGMSPMRPRTSRYGDISGPPPNPLVDRSVSERDSPKAGRPRPHQGTEDPSRPNSGSVRVGGFDRPGSTSHGRRIEQPSHVAPGSRANVPVHGVKSIGGMYGGLLGRLAMKENQDDYFVQALEGTGDFFVGVADGHGVKGGQVSNFVKSKMKEKAKESDKGSYEPESYLRKIFKETQDDLKKSGIDCNESGTTAVSVLRRGQDLYVANVGDSRAILVRDNSGYDLSSDHKPERHDEKQRILRCNGAVEPIKAMNGRFVGPHRVWVKKQVAGGLAMSRSLGDLNMTKAGVIPDPEIKRETLTSKDKYLVLGSDGVFEHMSSNEVAQVARKYDDPRAASDAIVVEARKRWANSQTGYCDDITALVVKLQD